MASLGSLVAADSPVLLIDTASGCIHVGLLRSGFEPVWWRETGEAGVALFEGVASVLGTARVGPNDLGATVFCEGPGSILGVRSAAMAIRAWQAAGARALPAFSYFGLELVASDLAAAGGPFPFGVIADARRGCWHFVEVDSAAAAFGPPRRVPASAIATFKGNLYLPAEFAAWAVPPPGVRRIPYSPPELWRHRYAADLLRPAPEPDAFQYEEASYALWTPRIHRAPPAGAGCP